MGLDIEVRLDTPGDDSPLVQYPDISDSKMDRLGWYVTGEVGVRSGATTITSSPLSNDGYLTDYLWVLLMRFNEGVTNLPSKDPIEIQMYDNPGQFRLTGANDGVRISFDSQTEERVERDVVAGVDELYEATISATESLLAELRSINPKLNGSDPVRDLQTKLEATKQNRADQH